eukprot:GFKZ01001910.1.p1 GENE.GFKZ01001910.1~~GFKZ01001910.1.p1  ORF type:complete len:459 (+),score=37.89 GFKZ01001910.1:169-1545(+)
MKPPRPSPFSPTRPTKRPRTRIHLVSCPICHRHMSTILLDTHIDRCKAPRPRPATSPVKSAAQSHPTPAISQHDQILSQSHITPPPPIPALYFSFATAPPSAAFIPPPATATTLPFAALISLRGHLSHPASPLHLHLHHPSALPHPHPLPPLPPGSPSSRLPPSLLLSALQKSIRRRHPYPAIRIAATIVRKQNSLFELLRRLTIIAIEDAVLHPNYPTLVWLFAASSKGYRPGRPELALVLQTVYQIAAVSVRDVAIWHESEPDPHFETSAAALVQALCIRACYGGMKGDTAMLHRSARVWSRRMRQDAPGWERALGEVYRHAGKGWQGEDMIAPLFSEGNQVLRLGDIPVAAFDMHCCSVGDEVTKEVIRLGGELVDRFGGGEEELRKGIEGLIWRFRSSVSRKRAFKELHEVHSTSGVGDLRKDGDGGLDEVLWKSELEGLVNEWCRRYRKRFGL